MKIDHGKRYPHTPFRLVIGCMEQIDLEKVTLRIRD